jgi:anti-anti-sigma factor
MLGEHELDFCSGDRLTLALRDLLRDQAPLSLDLSDLTFLDSAGLRTLLLARYEAQKRGIDLGLVNAERQVRSVFACLGMEALLG